MLIAAEFGTGQMAWSILWGALTLLWALLVIVTLGRILFDDDYSGWAKAAWALLLIVLPFFGVIIYLATKGDRLGGATRPKTTGGYRAGLTL